MGDGGGGGGVGWGREWIETTVEILKRPFPFNLTMRIDNCADFGKFTIVSFIGN
jgi:hypothetical protein